MYTDYSTPISPVWDVASQSPKASVLLPPSSALPPLSKLSSFTSHHIFRALDDLRNLYWPPKTHTSPTAASIVPSNLVLPTRKLKHLQAIHDHSVPDSGYASAEEETDDEDEEGLVESQDVSLDEPDERAEILRADPFERAFAIKWVTGFIARADIWVEETCEEDEGTGECEDDETASGEWKKRQEAVDKATAILSLFIGDEGLGEEDSAVTRSFSFLFGSGGEVQQHVKVELNDDPLDSSDHTSVGLQSWASAVVMSEKMSADPQAFSLGSSRAEGEMGDRRILELGAGTGLLSIVTAKILELQSRLQSDIISSQQMTKTNANTIIATDFHPDVLANCTRNVETNFPSNHRSASTQPAVLVHKLDWEHPDYSYPVDEPFDLILAADVIYHPEHAKWIRGVVERLLKKPPLQSLEDNLSNATVGGIFWMMMAVRSTGRHEGLDKTVDEVFPSFTTSTSGATAHIADCEGNGQLQLAITHRAEFAKQGGLGRADEGGYKLFGIEWVPSTRV